ncbi:MAG: AAA family ATPase [Desulfonatronovibrio sp.]
MADKPLNLLSETGNNKLRKTLENMVASVDGFSLQADPDSQKIDLLIYELGRDTAKEFQDLKYRMTTGAVGDVFLIAEDTDREILLQAIKIGAKEFFNLPLKDEEFRSALENYKKNATDPDRNKPKKIGQIIDVLGSRGGVGTTTVAVNLAVSLARQKDSGPVALFDMNTLFGEVPTFLDLNPNSHWGDIAKNINRVDSTFLMNILARHESGVHVLPSPAYMTGYINGRVRDTAYLMSHLLNIMRSTFDYTVIDGGVSFTDISLRGLQMADRVFMVSVLNIPSLANINKLLDSLRDIDPRIEERVRVVINRYIKDSAFTLKEAEESIKKEIYWTIPNDYYVTMSAINQGIPLYKSAPRANVTKNLAELADRLVARDQQQKKPGKFLKLFRAASS